jgi:hypothetical protein
MRQRRDSGSDNDSRSWKNNLQSIISQKLSGGGLAHSQYLVSVGAPLSWSSKAAKGSKRQAEKQRSRMPNRLLSRWMDQWIDG